MQLVEGERWPRDDGRRKRRRPFLSARGVGAPGFACQYPWKCYYYSANCGTSFCEMEVCATSLTCGDHDCFEQSCSEY
ncbi:MAG: hypothetical protein GF330_11020 [Candidatus Eisenbacteria bacterium]|nr:hypothetical protein [Candidatus Eisenbacteria bacterium]